MARRQILAALMMCVAYTVQAAGTAAGTAVTNQARVSYTYGALPLFVDSNVVTFRVDAVLDVAVSGPPQAVHAYAGAPPAPLPFFVTNTGNFPESFEFDLRLHLPGDDFDPIGGAPPIYFDSDGSGGLTTADQAFVAGAGGRRIEPDETVTLFVVAGVPQSTAASRRGAMELYVRGLTGIGAPGTTFAGRGPAGVDVVAGDRGGGASARVFLEAHGAGFSIAKSVVTDLPSGEASQRGTRLTYRLDVLPLGAGSFRRVRVKDSIPVGTRYVAGSLRLDGSALSDADDGDAGRLVANGAAGIEVDLLHPPASGGSRIVQFSVVVE